MNKPALHDILLAKRDYLKQRKAETPLDAMRALAAMQKRPQPILSTVTNDGHVLLFGQIRYGTPSYDPVTLALRYASAGLDAITLFTDNLIYGGGINDLALITRAVSVPVLLQNYIFDEYQVVEARAAGADALALVAGMLDPGALRQLISATQRNRMSPIVRVSTLDELREALDVSAPVIEIGKRDAETGVIDLDYLRTLREAIPATIACRVLFYNRLRTFEEAAAVAALKPDAVLISPRLLAEDGAIPQLRDVFRT